MNSGLAWKGGARSFFRPETRLKRIGRLPGAFETAPSPPANFKKLIFKEFFERRRISLPLVKKEAIPFSMRHRRKSCPKGH